MRLNLLVIINFVRNIVKATVEHAVNFDNAMTKFIFNSSLWKRVIAWGRSRAASGGLRSKQTWRNLVWNVIAWIVVVTAWS